MKKYIRNTAIALMTATALFSCDKFLEESPKDKLPEDEVYNNLSDLYLNAVASLYTYIGGYSDSQGLQGTGRGVYDLNTFTTTKPSSPLVAATGTTADSGKDCSCTNGELKTTPSKPLGNIFIK